MFFIEMVQWWYLRGWSWVSHYFLHERNTRIAEFFSMRDLLRTLFAPYRQTFAGRVDGTIGDKLRGLVDSTVSRVIGFIVRIILILAGTLLVVLNSLVGMLCVIAWPLVPALPIIAVILYVTGLSNGI